MENIQPLFFLTLTIILVIPILCNYIKTEYFANKKTEIIITRPRPSPVVYYPSYPQSTFVTKTKLPTWASILIVVLVLGTIIFLAVKYGVRDYSNTETIIVRTY